MNEEETKKKVYITFALIGKEQTLRVLCQRRRKLETEKEVVVGITSFHVTLRVHNVHLAAMFVQRWS